jgi:oxygen-independent coproporphyrinogen-3 oxidase
MAGIYLHIPFCKKKCHYCDFYKTLDTGLSDRFISSVLKEIKERKDYLSEDSRIGTIYFGGGTPSVLNIKQVRKILKALDSDFLIDRDAEISFEINPDDADKSYLRDLKREGINRLSIGVQSWDDRYFKILNRRHDASQALACLESAREAGFDNISVDLIYGIPGMTPEEWEKSLKTTIEKDVEHISAYHLTIEKNTMFGKMKDLGELKETDEEISERQFAILTDLARRHNYIHYEISNLCREGYYSKHNTNYWKQVNYLGFGPSAHSYNGYSRQWNISDIAAYLDKTESGERYYEKELLDEKVRYNEYIMTSLRTMWGVDMNYIETSFNKETHDYLLNLSSRFIKYGMIARTEKNNLALTDQGKMISDNIISELMMV